MSVIFNNVRTENTMISDTIKSKLQEDLQSLREMKLFKSERIISSPQGAVIITNGKEVINFCSNNYLGLANHARLVQTAKKALDERGFGLSSVRFICGTQDLHKVLEQEISSFFQTDDSILFAACFDANGGVFEPFFQSNDVILSDELNHASIIDGIRLSKAERHRYQHKDTTDLEHWLKKFIDAPRKIIVTDGVFSMDGDIAPLKEICDLADKYDSLVMVDDCHGSGFLGDSGRGSCEVQGVLGRVDLITSTLGKALGGANGGFITGRKVLIEWLRQKARPYLFSNTLPPSIVAASIEAFHLVDDYPELREQLVKNTLLFRTEMKRAGFQVLGETPIVPILLGNASIASEMSELLLQEGIFVIGFSYPVVPHGQARIRVQLSAVHTRQHIEFAVAKFTEIGKHLGVIS